MNTKAADFLIQTVSDINESVTFYRDTLGLDLETFNEEIGWAEFALPPTTLALGEVNPHAPLSPGSGGTAVAIAVDDVEQSTNELRDEGLAIMMEPADSGVCDMAVVGDPDDNPLMLHQRHDGTCGRVDPFPDEDP